MLDFFVFGRFLLRFFAALVLLQSRSVSVITWISLVCLAALLAIGVSWSHFWRRITGQINVEDVDT